MTCFNPRPAVRILELQARGENPIKFISGIQAMQLFGNPNLMHLPCGKCIGCRLSYSKGWAVRDCHEAELYEYNSFVTLTYNDDFLPSSGTLRYRDVQLFLKRLRKAKAEAFSDYGFYSDELQNLRFFMCGEYGDKTLRPHYHILFFNLDFSDGICISNRNGYKLFRSDSLSSFWTCPLSGESMGHCSYGTVTVASAGYVARYSTKKALCGDIPVYYNRNTGEVLEREFTQMSRRPGIAKEWFNRFHNSIYPSDEVIMANGRRFKPPRFYDSQLESMNPVMFEDVKQNRLDFANTDSAKQNSSVERLIVRERIQLDKMALLPRFL